LSASFDGDLNTRESIKWALILIAFNVLPIFLFTVWLVRHNKLDGMLALFVAFFSVGVVFMCINNWWKVSVHTASTASVVAALLIIYGLSAMALIMLVPLVAWARVELENHSLAQVVAGALLAPSMLVVEVHLFGLI